VFVVSESVLFAVLTRWSNLCGSLLGLHHQVSRSPPHSRRTVMAQMGKGTGGQTHQGKLDRGGR
jgi:hypothetical protein